MTGGAGVLSYVVAAIFGGQAKDAQRNVEKTANAGGTFDPGEDRRGRSAQTKEVTFIIVGTAALAAGGDALLPGYAASGRDRITPAWERLTDAVGGSGSRGRGLAGDVLMRARLIADGNPQRVPKPSREGLRRAIVHAIAVTVVVLGGLGACTYAPDFGNDMLVCGPGGSCPKGYSCDLTDSKCWKTGETPGSGGANGGSPGTGGAHMDASSNLPTSSNPRDGFVGTWTFTGGTLNGSCSDSPTAIQRALNGNPSNGTPADYILIGLGTLSATLNAKYFCDTGWTMQLSSGNTMAVASSNQSCVQRTTDNSVSPPVTTAYTWSPTMFSLTKTSATAGTTSGRLHGHLRGRANGSAGTCGRCGR